MMWPHPKPVTPGHSCVTTRKAAKMSDHNDPEFGFDKTAALSDPGPVAQVKCEEHHWVSTHQPDFPVYWITQCSQCGRYDADAMAEEIAKIGSKAPSSPAETTAGVSGTTSYTGVVRDADGREGLTGRVDYRAAIMAVDVNNDTDPILRTRIANACMAVADVEHDQLWDVIRANGDTNARLLRERDEARSQYADARQDAHVAQQQRDEAVDLLRHAYDTIAERDATIERLFAQLNEATNVPDDPCQGCSDEHCTATT